MSCRVILENSILLKNNRDAKNDNYTKTERWPHLENPEYAIKHNKENFKNVKLLIDQIISNIPLRNAENKNNKKLIKNYFTSWKTFVNNKKKRMQNEQRIADQHEKLENFLKKIKKTQKVKANKIETDTQNRKMSKNKVQNYTPDNKKINKNVHEQENKYKHRFQAQQNIINVQKTKLEQQCKLIEDLKLGKITVEIAKSLENTKNEIREIFSKSSAKIKCRISPLIEDVSNKSINFELRTDKAPKIIQEMEKRAQERALKRQIILERKRIIDEEKKRVAALILEQKRIQDEEEKKRNLEAMKEKRRKEMELHKIRRINKEKYFNNLNKAIELHERHLKFFGLKCFVKLVIIKRDNMEKSIQFYDQFLVKKCFNKWLLYYREIESKINERADLFYKNKILIKYIDKFKLVLRTRRQSMQVACDLYDLKLEIKTFSYWHRYVCKEYMIIYKKTEKAKKHFER